MLKTALCVILAVTAAMAWEQLDAVPSTADVEDGAHITYGANCVWGVFPTPDDEATYAGYYDLSDTDWHMIEEVSSEYALEYTGA